jgi:glycosyltransferase involved in cell wall biosynthesis
MPNFLVFSALIPKIAGSKVVLYLFESMPEIWAQKKEIPMDNTFIRVLCLEEKISCIFADHLIVCHTIAKEALVKRGIPGQKITVIMNVPDEKNFFAPAPPQKTENAGLRLVQHGTMTDNYGIQVVIKAVALLKDECQITYDVIGQGEYKEALYALAAGLGVEDRVNFRGFLPKEEMISVIQESDAGIVPMLFEYQSPNKMFEYFLFHKPVIASNRKTFLQYFDENEVIYFKTNDEEDLSRVLKYYYHHKDEFAAYASAAARRFSDYVWAKEKQKYTAVYKESEQIN